MRKTALSILVAGVVALSLSGCGQSVQEQLSKGKSYLDAADYRAAGIEFKAVLQNDRQNLAARMGLAELNRRVNDLPAEEKELQAILSADDALLKTYNIDKVDISNQLARLYAKTENSTSLLEMDDVGSPEIRYLKTLELLMNERTDVTQLPKIDDEHYAALQSAAISKQSDPAKSISTLIAMKIPSDNVELLRHFNLLQFEVLYSTGATKDAISALAAYVEKSPFDYPRAMQLAHLYISTSEFTMAKPIVGQLLTKFSRHALVSEMNAILLYQENKYKEALEAANVASIADPNAKMARIIAGYSAFHLQKPDVALSELNQVVSSLDGSHPAKRLHIQLRAMSGKAEAKELANDALQLTNLTAEDLSLLSQMGIAMARRGDVETAKALEQKVTEASSNMPQSGNAAALGMLQLSLGNEQAFKTLEDGLSADSASIDIGNTLASAYLASGKLDDALRVADAIAEKQPVQSALLKGVVMAQKGDHANAVKQFNASISLKSDNPAAKAGLVESYVILGNLDAAHQMLVESKNESNAVLMYRHYLGAMTRAGKGKEGATFINSTLKDTTSSPMKLMNSQAYFVSGLWSDALKTLPQDETVKGIGEYWMIRVGSQMQQGDKAALAQSYHEWLKVSPSNQMALMGHISALVDAKQINEAIDALNSHAQYHKEKTPVYIMKFHLQVMTRDYAGAQLSWNNFAPEVQKSVVGQGLDGILDVTNEKFSSAIAKLSKLYDEVPSEQYLVWLYFAYEGNREIEKGIDKLEEHLKKETDSVMARTYLANGYAQTGKYKQAEEHYLHVIEIESGNTLILNNLAYVKIENGDYVGAEKYARQALQSMPGNQTVIDTLANALLKQGRSQEASTLIAPLINGDEEDFTAQTHVKIMMASGKRDEARKYFSEKRWKGDAPAASDFGL